VCDGFLTPPGTGEQVVNLWRLPSFVAGAATVKVEKAGLDEIRDLVTQGRPVLVALNLLAPDGKPGGSHFVVATGISSSGAILIYDPAPHFGKYALDDFLREFPSGGRTWRGEIAAVVRLTPGVTNEGGLLASGAPGFELYSAAGPCPDALQWQAAAADGRPAFPESGDTFFQRFCTGDAAQYMLEAAAAHRLTIFDLGVPASRQELTGEQAASYRMVRAPAWQAGVPQLELAAVNAVVNAATLSPALAPGSLAAIFGTGLSLRGAAPAVEIGGRPVPVTVASAFRIHAAIPADLPPGPARVAVGSAAGSAEAAIILAETAPAIFLYSPRQGAVFNSTGEANGPESPVARGGRLMVYATGLGAVSGEGAAARTVIPVRAFLGGTEATVSYAGPASGFPGVYQVNLALPASTPPGIDLPLALAQGEAYSNTVLISVR